MAHQADLDSWVRSTRCDTGTCVEAKTTDNDDVVIRNSTGSGTGPGSPSRAPDGAAFVADLKSRAVLAQ